MTQQRPNLDRTSSARQHWEIQYKLIKEFDGAVSIGPYNNGVIDIDEVADELIRERRPKTLSEVRAYEDVILRRTGLLFLIECADGPIDSAGEHFQDFVYHIADKASEELLNDRGLTTLEDVLDRVCALETNRWNVPACWGCHQPFNKGDHKASDGEHIYHRECHPMADDMRDLEGW